MIVVDTNIIAYLRIPGDFTPVVEAILEKDPYWIAPKLWRSEFRNVLTRQVLVKKLSLKTAIQIYKKTEDFFKDKDYEVQGESVLRYSVESGCSSYDCEFIALSQEKKASFVTLDKKILKTFPQIAISPEEFLRS